MFLKISCANLIASSRLICIGNVNAHDNLSPFLTVTGRDAAICDEILNVSLSLGLIQVFSRPTTLNSILDLVFLSTDLTNSKLSCEIVER